MRVWPGSGVGRKGKGREGRRRGRRRGGCRRCEGRVGFVEQMGIVEWNGEEHGRRKRGWGGGETGGRVPRSRKIRGGFPPEIIIF